jgi:homocysteine S-methyltransferase
MPPFLEALDQRVLVCDGAMGTLLYANGVFLNRSFDELNLTRPELITDIHRQYLRAGADVIETNTFGANRFKLANFGLAEACERINREGARLARVAAEGRAWVAGAIGPLGVRLEPLGRTTRGEADTAFGEQASVLAADVDLFILETFFQIEELALAIAAVRRVSSLPIVAQLTTGEDGHTLDGTPPEMFAPALERAGADVIGVNCSVGPAAMLETVERMAQLSTARVSAQPNAGRPRDVDGRTLYLSSPEYLASYARRFVAAGVRLVGGCCGTTPEHIRHMATAVREATPNRTQARSTRSDEAPAPVAPIPVREKSTLGRAFVEGRFATVVEVATPRGTDLSASVAFARRVQALGATAVNVPDYPQSGPRPSALALSALVEQGRVETLLHYACRGRRLVNIQSDLVGAHALGLRNLLITTGSPILQSTYADASSVAEVDAIGLVKVITGLNRGLDMAGQPLAAPTRFHVGVAVNPFSADPDAEWRRLTRKVEAGAEFLVTPPVFDLEAFDGVLPRLSAAGLPIVVGVAALQSLRHAEFLASEVVGVRVPDGVLARLSRAKDQSEEAMMLTLEIVAWLASRVQGIEVTSFHGSPIVAERLLVEMRASAEGMQDG